MPEHVSRHPSELERAAQEARLRCSECYCERLPTHYVQYDGEVVNLRGEARKVVYLRLPYCAEHAPADAVPILDDWL